MGPDQSTPVTPGAGAYVFTGASPSLPATAYSWMPPSMARASVFASGLKASESTWCSLELTRRGCMGDGDGVACAVGLAAAGEPVAAGADGDSRMGVRFTGSRSAPWSMSEIAASVPSGLNVIGPSSWPGFSGNALSTPRLGLRKYQAPVAAPRTAMRPSTPGAAPSVNSAG